MKVSELIAALQKVPPDLEVLVYDQNEGQMLGMPDDASEAVSVETFSRWRRPGEERPYCIVRGC